MLHYVLYSPLDAFNDVKETMSIKLCIPPHSLNLYALVAQADMVQTRSYPVPNTLEEFYNF